MLSVSSDVKKLSRSLDQKFKRQIPFITSVALNLTMFDACKTVQKALPKFLDRSSPFTTKAVQFQKSSKKKLISFFHSLSSSSDKRYRFRPIFLMPHPPSDACWVIRLLVTPPAQRSFFKGNWIIAGIQWWGFRKGKGNYWNLRLPINRSAQNPQENLLKGLVL